jgi:hypothetical protein
LIVVTWSDVAEIATHHAAMLAGSTITPEHARARGYRTVAAVAELEDIGITPNGRRVPGLLVPLLDKRGDVWGYQYRPDRPRRRKGHPVRYESPLNQHNHIDVPPGVGRYLDDPAVPLWITEGSKKADAAACAGLACIALLGVWGWRGTNGNGTKAALSDWDEIALKGREVILAFDSDVMRKAEVRSALDRFAAFLERR